MVFKIGQKVACIADNWVYELNWWDRLRGYKEDSIVHPSKGEVVTIEQIDERGYLAFEEYPQFFKGERESYHPGSFVHVIRVKETAKETSELANTFVNQN